MSLPHSGAGKQFSTLMHSTAGEYMSLFLSSDWSSPPTSGSGDSIGSDSINSSTCLEITRRRGNGPLSTPTPTLPASMICSRTWPSQSDSFSQSVMYFLATSIEAFCASSSCASLAASSGNISSASWDSDGYLANTPRRISRSEMGVGCKSQGILPVGSRMSAIRAVPALV